MTIENDIVWDYPKVQVDRRRKFSVVDYDMWSTGERMSLRAFDELSSFIQKYYEAGRPMTRRAESGTGLTAGQIEVLPAHAEEIAARILLHLTDPKNHDPELHAKTRKLYIPGDARGIKRNRQKIEAAYPEFVDDPLGDVPRLPTRRKDRLEGRRGRRISP